MADARELEARRIQQEYKRRAAEIPPDRYALYRPENLFFATERLRRAVQGLQLCGLLPLEGKKILEVGCGARGWLPDLEAMGAHRGDLHGIDLDAERVS